MAARPEKVAVVDEVKESLDGAIATILTDYRGLSVGELAELRAELRKTNATYKVAKNTLMRRAAADAGIDIEDLLVGPTALVFCDDDPVGPAKALKAFAKDHPELIVKGSWFDGERLDAEATVKLADLQSRDELLTKLAGLMHGALANTARLLNAAPTKFAQLLAALQAEGGPEAKGFTPSAPAEAPAAPDEAATDEAAGAGAAAEDGDADADGVTEAAAEVVEEVSEAAESVAEAAGDAVETAAAATAEVAEKVADAADAAADAVAPDETDDQTADSEQSDAEADGDDATAEADEEATAEADEADADADDDENEQA